MQIIDEAQYIKNHGTQVAKAVKEIRSEFRLALTGTPVENRLSELWSIFDFLMPGFLYSYEKFRKEIELPAVQYSSSNAMERLQKMIRPFVLRRLKKDVLNDLPDKLEKDMFSPLESEQKGLYEAHTERLRLMLGMQSDAEFRTSKLQILAEITRLRQICCYPGLVYEGYEGNSSKLEMCMELVRNAVNGGHKILLFSQFTTMLDVLATRLSRAGISFYMLTGATSKEKRARMVQAFNEDDTSVFCISLKAGGTGLNLTAADIVIHYDPWWNLAVQNQATDRAHRIGQQNVVSVYRLFMKDTIEERIRALQEKKRELADDVKAAVVGVFGKDALECAPTCELKFKDPVEAVKQTVEEIRKNEKVDMIACVSHGGTWEDENKSEDEILAKEVPDIDLIISGHTHSELKEAIQHGNTYIVSCGEYGRNLGSLSMTQKQDGRWELTSYELIPVSEDVKPDQATQEQIDALMDTVDKNYLADFGYTREEVLAENDVEFNSLEEMGTKHEELNLGDIMSDAYIYAVENSEYYDGDPVDVAVVPSGTVRDTYTKGDITVEDVFNSFSLGIGKDGVAGYPLISAYLTGKELRLVAEVDASVSDFMTTARLYCSGLNFAYNPHRMILNKVTDCYLTRADGERIEIQDDKLYHVVTDLYTGQMLGSVMKMSYGLLSLEPKDRDGNPIENLEDQAIMEDDRELKAWDAIARYMQSFEDTDSDGIANVPEYYETTHGRKVVEDSRNIIDLVKQPNKFSAMIAGICLILIVIIVLVVFLIRRMIRRIKVRKGKRNSK